MKKEIGSNFKRANEYYYTMTCLDRDNMAMKRGLLEQARNCIVSCYETTEPTDSEKSIRERAKVWWNIYNRKWARLNPNDPILESIRTPFDQPLNILNPNPSEDKIKQRVPLFNPDDPRPAEQRFDENINYNDKNLLLKRFWIKID